MKGCRQHGPHQTDHARLKTVVFEEILEKDIDTDSVQLAEISDEKAYTEHIVIREKLASQRHYNKHDNRKSEQKRGPACKYCVVGALADVAGVAPGHHQTHAGVGGPIAERGEFYHPIKRRDPDLPEKNLRRLRGQEVDRVIFLDKKG